MMYHYALFPGEARSNTFTLDLDPLVASALEAKCRADWQALFQVQETRSPFVPYESWMKTEEGRVHWNIFQRQFDIQHSALRASNAAYVIYVSVDELNLISSRLQARRRNPKGSARKYAPGYQSLKEYRKFRAWWLSAELAKQLGVQFNTPCPVTQTTIGAPVTSYIEMGKNFEEWTGYAIASELWDELKQLEATRIAREAAQNKQQLAA